MSARGVVDDIRATDAQLGFLLDVAISRALVVAELALGGMLAERLRQVDSALIHLAAAVQDTADDASASVSESHQTGARFMDQPTIPFLRPDRPVTGSGVSQELMTAISRTLTIARGRCAPRAELLKQILSALEVIATDTGGNFAAAVISARDLYGIRPVDDAGIMPVFDALDQARILTAASVHQIQATDPIRAQVLRAISFAHQRLVGAMTGLVLEAVAPISDRLREAQAVTSELRDEVARTERERAKLERLAATNVDYSQPWGKRGTTEW
jgi:hypothetical protein